MIKNAINKAVEATKTILESARIDSLREDGPARGQLLVPSRVASCRIREKQPAGKTNKQSRHRALFIPKEGKETLEVNLERNGLTTGDYKVSYPDFAPEFFMFV